MNTTTIKRRRELLEELKRRREDRSLVGESLAEFSRRAWPVLEPVTPIKWGWCLDAICEHLEAVTNGEITHLVMNVPPGSMKSLLTSVFWPAWEWGPRNLPHHRIISTSHSGNLALRDNIKARRLIKSDWYQRRWPLDILDDQDTKFKFENAQFGFRECAAFTNMTGSRGDRVILDDPLSAEGANSDAERESAVRVFRETLPSRVNNEKSSIVVIMQRLHERDPTGVILEDELDYCHLCIPMEYEEDHPYASTRYRPTKIGWSDPRTEEGQLMFPDRFPVTQINKLKKDLGAYASAGQLQQRPAPRGGGFMQLEWLNGKYMNDAPTKFKCVARGWDLAGSTKKKSPWTRGAKVGIDFQDNVWLLDMKGIKGTPSQVEDLILQTAKQDGFTVLGSLPQDPGQAGKAQVEYLIKKLIGYPYTASPESGDKQTRAGPVASQMEMGNFYILRGPWVDAFIEEMVVFPAGKFSDQIDALSRAFMRANEGSVYTLENV